MKNNQGIKIGNEIFKVGEIGWLWFNIEVDHGVYEPCNINIFIGSDYLLVIDDYKKVSKFAFDKIPERILNGDFKKVKEFILR